MTALSEKTVLVTGADGFIGQALCEALASARRPFRRAMRKPRSDLADAVAVGDIGPETDWGRALEGVACVVHLAARTHVLRENGADSLSQYRRVNVGGTARLGREAARAGVKRLVFVSSVKVNGESTDERPFTESDPPRPEDAYGISKWEAEQALWQIAGESNMEVVVLRPPLVYGPGVKGNFLRLLRLVRRGVPLPLASVHNRRSLIYVGNLIDAIVACLEAPAAAGKTYLVSDGEDVSTPDLIRALAAALGVPARLFPFPAALLAVGAGMFGKSDEIARLIGSLQVDGAKIRNELAWHPRFSLAQGLEETAEWYRGMIGDGESGTGNGQGGA